MGGFLKFAFSPLQSAPCSSQAPVRTARIKCFDICIQECIEQLDAQHNKVFDHRTYVTNIPKCMQEIGRCTDGWGELNHPTEINVAEQKLCPDEAWGALKRSNAFPHFKNFFACVNLLHKQKDGGKLWKSGATIIAWSGTKAQEKAGDEAKKSDGIVACTLPWLRKPHRPYAWSSFSALDTAYQVLKKKYTTADAHANRPPSGAERDWKTLELGCNLLSVWLVSHADWTYPVHQYSSINWFFLHDNGKKEKNAGTDSLLKAGVAKGLMISSIFWNTEMITLFRMAKQYVELHYLRSRWNKPKLMINMMEYDDRGIPKKSPDGEDVWATAINLFGKISDLQNIPIFFNPVEVKNKQNRRFFTSDQMEEIGGKNIKNLLELMKYYDSSRHSRSGEKLIGDENALFISSISEKALEAFVDWTMKLKPEFIREI